METVAVPKGKVPAADASAACGRQPETGDVVAAANVKSRLFQTLSRRRSSDFGLEVAPMTFGGTTLAFLIVSSFFSILPLRSSLVHLIFLVSDRAQSMCWR